MTGISSSWSAILSVVSGHDIAGIWVAFFSRCQRYRCWQVGWLENAAQNKAIGDARWASWFGTVSRNPP